MTKVLFRTDASIEIGIGHVMRCRTLADALREQGAECTFVCRAHPGHMADRIQEAGHAVHLLPAVNDAKRLDKQTDIYAHWLGCTQELDAKQTLAVLDGKYDWLVVDHYGLDRCWESALRPRAERILAIDDLANRAHDCDLLLDQNLGRAVGDYDALVPRAAARLIGPRYALLRPEFAKLREYSLERRKKPRLKRILVTMGGVDKENLTGRVLDSLARYHLPENSHITVVMGPRALWLERIKAHVAALPKSFDVVVDPPDVAQLIADTDLAIGAAGGSAWERCALGVPTVIIVAASNQLGPAAQLQRAGAVFVASDSAAASRWIVSMSQSPDLARVREMSKMAARICDAYGRVRVVNAMQLSEVRIRSMREDDIDAVLQWRNHPSVRRWMYNSHEITLAEHRKWYDKVRNAPGHWLLIVEGAGRPLGFVQFTTTSDDGVADWGFYKVPDTPSGTGRKVGLAALRYAFNELGLRKIRGETVESNDRSIAFHKALGFVDHGFGQAPSDEGRCRQRVHFFSLSADNWPGL